MTTSQTSPGHGGGESGGIARPSLPATHGSGDPIPRSASFTALLEDIRTTYLSGWPASFRPADGLRRRLGVAPASPAAAFIAVVVGVGGRLGLALLVTAAVGQWSDVPWASWAVISLFYALTVTFSTFVFTSPEVPIGPWLKRAAEEWTALLPLIERESDLRDLDESMRRLERRTWLDIGVGLSVAAAMLSVAWLVAPTAMDELPAGSMILLAILLFDFGSMNIYGGTIGNWAFIAQQARYDYLLFWPSPADTPEVQTAIRSASAQGLVTSMWFTVFLMLTIVLVSWDSPLVIPLGAGFIVIGYLVQLVAALRNRANIQKIVQRARERYLMGLRSRIEEYRPRYNRLSHDEAEELRDLLFLHDKIRDAPTAPTTTRTVVHSAVGLIVPTVLFLATVFGEVYAERFFDTMLP